jgi:hypothetical protein
MTGGMWRVLPIPGKGLGVVATRGIASGEVIMAERPLVVIVKEFSTGRSQTKHFGGDRETVEKRLLQLSKESSGENDVERAVNANGFV